MQSLTCVAHRLAFASLFVGSVLITGCATTDGANTPTATAVPPEPVLSARVIYPEPGPTLIPVARYGRYTLVELVPEPAQRDLTRQVIEVRFRRPSMRTSAMPCGTCCCAPATGSATRRRPRRCTRCRCRRRICGWPLPLRDALLALAGPAWELSVDDASRAVCFTRVTAARSAGRVPAVPAPSTTEAEPAQPQEAQP